MIGIAKDKAYLNNFYKAKTMEDKAKVVDKYEREKLDMVANNDMKDYDRDYFPKHPESPLSRKFCEVTDEAKDAILLCQDCTCHHCGRLCMQDNKKATHLPCWVW